MALLIAIAISKAYPSNLKRYRAISPILKKYFWVLSFGCFKVWQLFADDGAAIEQQKISQLIGVHLS
jgi:hypothetical protein